MILVGFGTVGLALSIVGPLVVPISAFVGSVPLAQTVAVTPFLGIGLSGLIAGWLIDRLGVRASLCLASLALILPGLVGLIRPPVPLLVAACFLAGASGAITKVALTLLVGQLYEGAARGRVIGYAIGASGFISATTVYSSGVITDAFGWKAALLQFTGGGVLLLVFTLAGVRPGLRSAQPAEAAERPRLSMLAPVAGMIAAGCLFSMMANSTGSHIPLLLKEKGVHTSTAVASVLTAQVFCAMVGALAYGRLQPRLGRRRLAALGVCYLVVGGTVLATAQTLPVFGIGGALFGLASGTLLPWLNEGVLLRAPPAVQGYALGVLSTACYLGSFVNPFVFRPIREVVGLQGLYGVLTVAAVLIGGAFVAGAYMGGRRSPVVPEGAEAVSPQQ